MSVTDQFANILRDVDRPGDFHVSGRVALPTPRIDVMGVGPLALPVLPTQAEALIKVATRAPYGRGTETIVDTSVRRTWQIEASQVKISGKHWADTLTDIVSRSAQGLGVSEPVTAELYKLLIYEKGSFFVGHRDTEKSPGMFATLVVALPSSSEGGELVVRHKDRDVRLDLANDEPSEATFAAFYADCVHEVLPVTQGCRVTLVFNLVRKARGKAPQPPDYAPQADRVATVLKKWGTALASTPSGAPVKLVFPLEHAYTPAELRFGALKGTDSAIAQVVLAAAPRAGVDIQLALLKIWESGPAEYVGGRSWKSRRASRYSDDDDDDSDEYEIVEVTDDTRTLSEWRRPDGTSGALGEIPFDENEVSPPDALKDMEPDEEHFQEATGNEGASFERTYSRAALVLWPSANVLAVLNQAGTRVTLPYLDDLITRWTKEGADPASPLRRQAEELARHMLSTWAEYGWHSRFREESTGIGRMLALLARLGIAPLIETTLAIIRGRYGHDKSDNPAILAALKVFPDEQAAEHLRKLVATNARRAPGSCAALLAAALDRPFKAKPALLLPAAKALVDTLPGDPATAPKDDWGRTLWTMPDAEQVADMITLVDRIDATLAKHFADHVLLWSRHFDPDTVLVPAMKSLRRGDRSTGTAFPALHQAAIAHLEDRIALTLEPPRDWGRANPMTCRCAHCRDLGAFLGDTERNVWTLRAVQDTRGHVEDEIRNRKPDLDTRTETKGRPYSLICTKNQTSYDRRVAERQRDLTDLRVLRQAPSPRGS